MTRSSVVKDKIKGSLKAQSPSYAMECKHAGISRGEIINRTLLWIMVFVMITLLAACSGGSGAGTEINPITSGGGAPANYTGPAAKTSDIQQFKLNIWDNLFEDNRCGACHRDDQTPRFVRADDINIAYDEANTVIDLNNPANSIMVTTVAGGHNCWLSSDQACADIITGWIADWAGGSGGSATVQLTAPIEKDPGASKNFPPDTTLFLSSGLREFLQDNCSNCHSNEAAIPISPYFASADINEAYQQSQSKINLDDDPLLANATSRFVVRLRDEFHNCPADGCQMGATDAHNAIQAMSAGITPTQPADNLVLSKALNLTDGILANSGGRFEANVIAQYLFRTGSGTEAFDTSGVDPAINLTLSGDVSWVGGWGINIVSGKAQGSTASSQKLYDLISATGEYSIEAWVAPGNVTQGDAQDPARIVSYSGGTATRNFTLGQTLYNYEFLNRSTNVEVADGSSDANGLPALATADADEDLQATLQHVVATYDPVNGRRIYVNGVFTDDADPLPGGVLSDWDNTFALVLGNEVSSDRSWSGVIRMMAIHNRVLTEEQILQNFDVGVGEKFFLLFGISDVINVPQSYIVFTVSQFDSYSYLFAEPFLVSLDANASFSDIPLAGMRLGINGREVEVGQAFANIDTLLTENSQTLSPQGAVIGLEKGSVGDEFFLTFERLGAESNVIVTPSPTVLPVQLDGSLSSDIGVRTFEEIDATMAKITGIEKANQQAVMQTYQTVRQALPSIDSIEAFLSSHQMAVTQLAISYCDALVETNAGFFLPVDINAAVSVADRPTVITQLSNAVIGTGLASQPSTVDVNTELDELFDKLCPAGDCSVGQTKPAVKGVCAAVLGSAAMLVQ